MKEIVLAMMLWIHNVTGYTIPEPPNIKYLSSFEIKKFAYGCDMNPIPVGFEDICAAKNFWELDDYERENVPLGLYDHERQIIILNQDMKKSEAHDHSVIFHELVHHMQFHNGVYDKIRCKGQLEKEAYELQDKWLQEKYNVRINETIGINDLFILMVINCGNDWYSYSPDPTLLNPNVQ